MKWRTPVLETPKIAFPGSPVSVPMPRHSSALLDCSCARMTGNPVSATLLTSTLATIRTCCLAAEQGMQSVTGMLDFEHPVNATIYHLKTIF